MGAQLSLKAAMPLAEILATCGKNVGNTGPWCHSLSKTLNARRLPLYQYLSYNLHSSCKPPSFSIYFHGEFLMKYQTWMIFLKLVLGSSLMTENSIRTNQTHVIASQTGVVLSTANLNPTECVENSSGSPTPPYWGRAPSHSGVQH